eukprot:GHUV01010250.1.p1 GENE.GHUV01010250.1~~GHUV01010250.1.p1  ORF type:complete len:297 (+),score=89.06 GHUV01010250.1:766-1656(+)
MLQKHAQAGPQVARGLVAEGHHVTTLNLNAHANGATCRAYVMEGNSAADIRIIDKGAVVAEAQVKTGKWEYIRRSLKNPLYKGMQKVVPHGMEDRRRGLSSVLRHGDITSQPLSNAEAEALRQNPKAHFDKFRPKIQQAASAAAQQAFVVGAFISATATLAAKAAQKGIRQLDRRDAAAAAEAGVVGGAVGAVASATAVVTGDAMLGAIAGGSVVTGYGVAKKLVKGDKPGAVREGFVGAASTTAAVTAGAACSFVAGPLGLACPLAAMLASSYARNGTWQLLQKSQERDVALSKL